ncbi:MAG: tripeptide aminopeptidase [Solirubrobacteraceae bacterium]|nr:tripeptide aminopeptidase [Solirubrobacteraceae bacterium]
MRRAEPAERRRLGELFAELCAIESPSRHERRCADRVVAELRALGLDVDEDRVGDQLGGDAGNVLSRVPGPPGAPTMLLCAHLDTVPPAAPIEPVLVDDGWENAHDGILGADNKAAVAAFLMVAGRCAAEPPQVGIELLFTVGEEEALAGAKAFDRGRLEASVGFVFDHASPLGEVVVASPTYHRIEAELTGAAAHAGIRPEAGRSAILAAARAIAAMPHGRLDPETTANVGTIAGGTAGNVVPDRCRILAEARSLDEPRVEQVVAQIVDALHDGANATECDLDVSVEALFRGYRTQPAAPGVRVAEQALRSAGFTPRHVVTGGGSDANALEAAGLPCVNLANGTERNHEPDERVSVAALGGALDVALALPAAAAEILTA